MEWLTIKGMTYQLREEITKSNVQKTEKVYLLHKIFLRLYPTSNPMQE